MNALGTYYALILYVHFKSRLQTIQKYQFVGSIHLRLKKCAFTGKHVRWFCIRVLKLKMYKAAQIISRKCIALCFFVPITADWSSTMVHAILFCQCLLELSAVSS